MKQHRRLTLGSCGFAGETIGDWKGGFDPHFDGGGNAWWDTPKRPLTCDEKLQL